MTAANGNGKAEKFKHLAERRTSSLIKNARALGRLSRRSSYEYTDAQLVKIFAAIRAEIDEAEAKFAPQDKKQKQLPLFQL